MCSSATRFKARCSEQPDSHSSRPPPEYRLLKFESDRRFREGSTAEFFAIPKFERERIIQCTKAIKANFTSELSSTNQSYPIYWNRNWCYNRI